MTEILAEIDIPEKSFDVSAGCPESLFMVAMRLFFDSAFASIIDTDTNMRKNEAMNIHIHFALYSLKIIYNFSQATPELEVKFLRQFFSKWQREQKRLELLVNTEPDMVRHCVSKSRKWKSPSMLNILAPFVERLLELTRTR